MEKSKRQCRICYKARQCINLDNRYRIGRHVWGRGGEAIIYGLWVCKECRDTKQDRIQNKIDYMNKSKYY